MGSFVVKKMLLRVRPIWLPLLIVIIGARFPTLGLVALCVGLAVATTIKASFVQRLFLSLLIVVAGNTLLYEVFNLLHLHPPIGLMGALYGLAGSILYIRRTTANPRPLFVASDVVCLVVGIVSFGALFYPIVINRTPQQSYSEATFHLLMSGEDNASHFAMFKYAYAHDGYAYMTNPGSNGLISGLTNYPQGSEFTMAWVTKGILGSAHYSNHQMLVKAFYALCALQFALLVSGVLLLATKLYQATNKRLGVAGGAAIAAIGIGLVAAGPLVELMSRGFQSQIAAYIFLVGLLYVLVIQKDIGSVKTTFFSAAILLGGVCTSWWFLGPVAAFPLAVYAWTNRTAIRTFRWPFFGWSIVLAGLAGYTLLLSLLSIKTSSVNDDGGVDVIAPTSIALYLVGYALVFLLPKADRKRLQPITTALVGCILFSAVVGVYQYIYIGHFAYYYYKSLYAIIPLSLAVVTYLALLHLQRISAALKRMQQLLVAVCIVVSAYCLLTALKPVYTVVYLHDWYNNPITPQQIRGLYHYSRNSPYQDMVFVGNCSDGINYISNRWSGAFFLSESPWRSQLNRATYYGDVDQTVHLLKHYPGQAKNVLVHVNSACLNPRLQQIITDKGFATTRIP
jgi:hypothetical protein